MKRIILVVSADSIMSAAQAESPNWNQFSLSYLNTKIDNVDREDFEPAGVQLSGSRALGEHVYFAGQTSFQTDEIGGADIEYTESQLGFGIKTSISETTDIFADLSYLFVQLDVDGLGDGDDSGFALGAGVRSMVTDAVELNAGVTYLDLGDIAGTDFSETRFRIGADYYFTKSFSGVFSFTHGEETSSFEIGLSFSY